ncbi:Centromere protein F, partial [Colius striatus]
MSWSGDGKKDDHSVVVVWKTHQLEIQAKKLKKEHQQRQFQLASLEEALQKEKVENEKKALKRENWSLMELSDSFEKAEQKISHDLQMKEFQVNIQSGQLNSTKTEEMKRL